MAEAALSATIKVLLGTVISLATDRTKLVRGFEKELEKLNQFATMIQDFLDDADEKMHRTAVRRWLNQLEEEVLKVENVLDELNYEKLRREVKYRNQLKEKVCFFFSYFSTTGLHLKLASEIRKINTNLERINRQANDLGLVVKCQNDAALPASARVTTSRLTDSTVVLDVVGRAKDESKIIEMLLSPAERVVSVIPITGMGGIGKTTLAKSVYNNPQIGRHFGKNKFWVCVARKIEIMDLFKFILVQLTEEEVKVDDRNVIVKKIGDKIDRKKYFLVLDDVWNHEQGLWNEFFTTLEGLNPTKGSWCLVTTRDKRVADAVSTILRMNHRPHCLEKLSYDECWSILRKMVLAGEEVSEELEAIRMQILRKCGGLPLAAKLIGGLLLSNGKEKWQSIVEDGLLNEDQGQINQILKVSFDHLSPPSVKKCFVYCSIFPQDTELGEDELTEHWIAEGFVLPDQNNTRMEETGGEYLRILLQHFLLEKVKDDWGTYYYKMHDLVHDFAKSILRPESSNQDRYLALNSSEGLVENTTMTIIPASIRTLFLDLEGGISADMLLRFKYLHVLRLSGDDVVFLPSSIGKLLHLRLLDISSSRITSLPESLCKLYNLQTLTMSASSLERGLPKRMSNLISLRHLNYWHDGAGLKMPAQMGQLTCLQILEFFNVSQERGCGIKELGTLKYLKGSLQIRNLKLVKGKEAAKQAKLFDKPNLSRLVFEWGNWDRESDNCDEDVLEGLQPHLDLQELEIHDFMGNNFPEWFFSLPKLVELRIYCCQKCSELLSLGRLPSLKRLHLTGLCNIRSITTNEEGRSRVSGSSTRRQKFFPALEELYVGFMENLVEAEADVFPMLRVLSIDSCRRLISLGVNGQKYPLPCLEDLRISNCKGLTTIPDKMFESCPSLRSMSVGGCPNLESFSLNLQGTPSLEKFSLLVCPKLIPHRFIGFASVTSLRELSVGPFSSDDSSMDDFDWSGLMSASTLRRLELRGLPHTESLPHQLQYLTTLTSLELYGFGGLKVLPNWIGNLVSLETLALWHCEKLRSLPSEAAMRHLTKLTDVEVHWCLLLRQRYTPEKGIYHLEEEISSDRASGDSAQTPASWCFPSLLKKKKSSGES